jgi:GNAT superfamily N-acetyltransferase
MLKARMASTPRVTPTLRLAAESDLPTVVRLFAIPDEGNKKDENPKEPLEACYVEALEAIARDPNNRLMVAELEGRVVGAFQLTIIQHVAHRGGRVAQIENVIVDPSGRGAGLGEAMMQWALDDARRFRCCRVQLTSNKVRTRAHRFYARLGFVASHEGFKMPL